MNPTAYLIQAARPIDATVPGLGRFTGTRQLPTFLLPVDALGLVSAEHAERVARDLLALPADAPCYAVPVITGTIVPVPR